MGSHLEGKLWHRQPRGAPQHAPQGGAQLCHAHRVGRCCIVDARVRAVLQGLDVEADQIIPDSSSIGR